MKYQRLSKEQFEELHEEFSNFLATQSIDKKEWDALKKNKPEVAEQELDVFSDLIWEGVLNNVNYVDHFSKHQVYFFSLKEDMMKLISIKSNAVDFLTQEGFQWAMDNLSTPEVEVYTATKAYSEEKNKDKFDLIRKGGIISKGELYKSLAEFIVK